ncbi:DUF4232 domain-containing protein [Streptomyces sp. NBC_01387]|uniref:DUF4232 domain-containing protein n=1 Tax=unclassified Streptomyces TaxID=2593676 RepID=UPI002024E40A|nr:MULTISPECIES: DUF4232 domain-containing protein [unclassified Streptomyces]MCX4552737.1 DUF4232 domain-containing protein [Streptomyces sp. NBC_01500]WSC24075.1 DUF4232 domain-containing protein [Streptomyces sp. NBC_01766]WSV57961.1 DUF4232 domain-containing protein [Streptomyces sp. NBC_01014]
MNTQLSRLPRRVAALLAVTALSLGAAACSSSSDSKGSSAKDSSASASDSSGSSSSDSTKDGSGNPPEAAGTGSTGGAKPAAAPNSSSGKGAPAAASASSRCHTSELKAGFAMGGDAAPDMKSDNQTQASVALTNISKRTCTLSGFPGVDIVGNQASDGTWSLARSSKPVTTISLSPGDTTDFSITLGATLEKGSGTFEPGLVRITPPNEKTQFALQWPFGGAITKQDGATHPATYVNPIGS